MLKKQLGLTLLNLLFSLTIIAVLVAIGVPTFSNIIDNHKRKTAIYQTVGLLNFARDSAVHLSKNVVLCSSSNNESCNSSKLWNEIVLIFVDNNKNQVRDTDELLLKRFSYIEEGQSLHWKSFGNHAYLTYYPDGSTGYQSGRFYYCQNEGEAIEDRGQVIVFRTGRSRIAHRAEFKGGC